MIRLLSCQLTETSKKKIIIEFKYTIYNVGNTGQISSRVLVSCPLSWDAGEGILDPAMLAEGVWGDTSHHQVSIFAQFELEDLEFCHTNIPFQLRTASIYRLQCSIVPKATFWTAAQRTCAICLFGSTHARRGPYFSKTPIFRLKKMRIDLLNEHGGKGWMVFQGYGGDMYPEERTESFLRSRGRDVNLLERLQQRLGNNSLGSARRIKT